MNKKAFIYILTLLCFSFSMRVSAQEIDYKGFPEWSWHKQDSTEYMLYTPANIEPGKKYPVALALHGCCGVDYHATMRNAVDPIVRMWHQFGENRQQVPTYIIAPKTSKGWKQHMANLKKVIDDLIAAGKADPQRIYISGFSMGGEGTFEMIQLYPGFFAAAITMGMHFHGDSSRVKDMPIWANQGETDWFSRSLRKDVASIRHANGDASDTGATWVTGVNPRYSNFKGVDHGVMWDAASKQDLTGWAYSKLNDGNIYPVVYFVSPGYRAAFAEGKPVQVLVNASDADGKITKLEVYLNGRKKQALTKAPYTFEVKPAPGDNLVRVVAFDNGGKASEASTIIEVPVKPSIRTTELKVAAAGAWYDIKLSGFGNGSLQFAVGSGQLPEGLHLYPDGVLCGIPVKAGVYPVEIDLRDGHGLTTTKKLALTVRQKPGSAVLVTDVVTREGNRYRTGHLQPGAAPFFDGKDSLLRDDKQEVNFNEPGKYNGLVYIQTDVQDANKTGTDFLSFRVDEPVIVYIAYEKQETLFHSTIPDWLKAYKEEAGELVAQYRYFALYSKAFDKGIISLPGAEAKANGVGLPYFVIIKKQ